MSKPTEQEHTEALDELRAMFPPGSTVRTVLRHVSKSGMSRAISVIATVDGEPSDVSWLVARAGVATFDRNYDGLKMGGCGMDMGFALVYNLSRVLYADGFTCIGKGCPSNDHNNDYGAFSRAYDDEHKGDSDWYVTALPSLHRLDLTPEQRAERETYQEAKHAAWKAGERSRYSKRRRHSDPGYALSHRWL